jgi:hypothetical protein
MIAGGTMAGLSVLLIGSPLVLGSGGPMKYVVAAGVVGACLGLSILLHATWDLLASRRFRKP